MQKEPLKISLEWVKGFPKKTIDYFKKTCFHREKYQEKEKNETRSRPRKRSRKNERTVKKKKTLSTKKKKLVF